MEHMSHIPLIGGFSIAAMNVFGSHPKIITSYSPFYNNDILFLKYLEKKHLHYKYIQLPDDISEDLKKDISETAGKIDVVTAVPPCSGLSASSALKTGARQISPVNEWMYKSAEFILSTIKPTVYVFENAPALFTDIGLIVRENLQTYAKKYDYAITFYKTDTLLHGIPQKRPRTYAIFLKGKYAPILNYIKKETPSVEEYLKSIPKDATLQNSFMCCESSISNYEIVKFLKMKYGNNWRNEMLEERHHITSYDFLKRRKILYEYRDFLKTLDDVHPNSIKDVEHVIKKTEMGKNFRLSHRVLCVDRHHVYAVIGEMMERNIHPIEDRRLNIREYMHLMGLPHDFDIPDEIKQYAKITQNVPVNTSEDILKEVKEIINENRCISPERFLMIDNTKNISIGKTKKLF